MLLVMLNNMVDIDNLNKMFIFITSYATCKYINAIKIII